MCPPSRRGELTTCRTIPDGLWLCDSHARSEPAIVRRRTEGEAEMPSQTAASLNVDRFWSTIERSAEIGKGRPGGLARLALTDADKEMREQFIAAGLSLSIYCALPHGPSTTGETSAFVSVNL